MAELPQQDGMDDETRRKFGRGELTKQQVRHLNILNQLTTKGAPMSTAELREVVGLGVTKRQFQRDLEHMAQTYDLSCSGKGRSKYWSVKPGSRPRFVLPVLDENAALAFHLADGLLREVLPEDAVQALTPWFVESKKLLAQKNPDNPWYERLTNKREGMQLDPPAIDATVLGNIYLALQKGYKLKIRHTNALGTQKEHLIAPAGIVASNQTLYLLTYSTKHEDYTSYAVHRITEALLDYSPGTVPKVEDFLDYVDCYFNEFYLGEDEFSLTADFHPHVQRKMLEYQLADDQQTKVLSDGWVRVTATVDLTGSLLTWLLGYGNLVRVIGPKELVAKLDDRRQAPPPPPPDAG